MSEAHNVTQILKQVEEGDSSAAEALLPLVYQELRREASEKLAQERPDQTLQATALLPMCSRQHFFGAAAEAMRRILLDKARRKNCEKHEVVWRRIVEFKQKHEVA